MIPWRDPQKELPEVDSVIWVLDFSHSKNGPLSTVILGARVREIKTDLTHRLIAENPDDIGSGWLSWTLKDFKAKTDDWQKERPLAWVPIDDLPLPGWIQSRSRL